MSMNPRMLVLAREAQGLTQEELARKVGMAQSVINKAEKGGRLLPDASLPPVATVLRVTPGMLCWTDDVLRVRDGKLFPPEAAEPAAAHPAEDTSQSEPASHASGAAVERDRGRCAAVHAKDGH